MTTPYPQLRRFSLCPSPVAHAPTVKLGQPRRRGSSGAGSISPMLSGRSLPPTGPGQGRQAHSNQHSSDEFALLNILSPDTQTLLRLTRAAAKFSINIEGYHGSSGLYNDYRAILRGCRSRLSIFARWLRTSLSNLSVSLQCLDLDNTGTLSFEVPDARGVVAETLALTERYGLHRHWDSAITYRWPFSGSLRLRQCIVLGFPDPCQFERFRREAVQLAEQLGSEECADSILTPGVHLLAST